MEFQEVDFGSFGGLCFEGIPLDEADVVVTGIPYESATSGKKGASFGPREIRKLSTDMQTVSRGGVDLNPMILVDAGDVPVFSIEGKKTRKSIENTFDYLFELNSNPIITLGGDHSNTYPILKSLSKRGKVGVIWFDAHRDVLSELMGSRWSHGSPLRRALEEENILSQNVLLVGTRYMVPSEQKFIEKNDIQELRMVDLENHDFDLDDFKSKVTNIYNNTDYLYVSIDIDVLDPAYAPATGTPVGGGLSTAQLMQMISVIPVDVTAFDIMEISPPHDVGEITVKAALGIISEILAQIKQN